MFLGPILRKNKSYSWVGLLGQPTGLAGRSGGSGGRVGRVGRVGLGLGLLRLRTRRRRMVNNSTESWLQQECAGLRGLNQRLSATKLRGAVTI